MILLLLICLITLTECVSWNEPCNINTQGRMKKPGPTKKDRNKNRGEMTFKRVTVLSTHRWEKGSFKWASISHINLFKEKHFVVLGTKDKIHVSIFHVWIGAWKNNSMLWDQAENLQPNVVVKRSDLNYYLDLIHNSTLMKPQYTHKSHGLWNGSGYVPLV